VGQLEASPANPQRLHQLDGLRAIAAALVVLHHAGSASLAQKLADHGHAFAANALTGLTGAGVELFFVLSGVVLLRPYARQRRGFDLALYIRRRIERLWPPYLVVWLLAGACIWLTTYHPSEWTRTANLTSFSFGSWLAQLGIVYFGQQSFNWTWWSLTVEILFYALVPLIIAALLMFRPTLRSIVPVWLVALVLAVLAQQIMPEDPGNAWAFYRFATYVSCFAAGVVIAVGDIPRTWALCLTSLGVVYILVACRWPSAGSHAAWGMFYFGLVAWALQPGSVLAGWLGRWPLLWLGERSYSLFLVHFSIINLVSQVVSYVLPPKGLSYFVVTRLVELPLSLFAAMLIFSFVERRFARNLASANAFWPSLHPPKSAMVG